MGVPKGLGPPDRGYSAA